jgi:hypothetical protein
LAVNLNISNIISGIKSAVTMAEQFIPELAALTPYGDVAATVVKAVEAATEVADNVVARIDEGEIVAHSHDQAQVKALAQQLHDLNDRIAEQIDAS